MGSAISGRQTAPGGANLTRNEGSLLALVLRLQPVTAYQLLKTFEESPTSSLNASKGGLYPLIARMKERGYLDAEPVPGDQRGAELLLCTEPGRRAIVDWIRQLDPPQALLEDPLRSKVLAFGLLSREERIEWIVDAKAILHDKSAELERFRETIEGPWEDHAWSNATAAIESRMRWLDRLMESVVKDKGG